MSRHRQMVLAPALVALCHRDEVDPGPDGRWTALTDEDYRAVAEELAAESGLEPLWVFAYGSLIWKPEFEHVESARATAYGWHRSFTLEINRWRGTRAQPGLMMALARGGRCDGVIYRLPENGRAAQIERMLRREISDRESLRAVRWLPVKGGFGRRTALGFWVGRTARTVSQRHTLDDVARVLARACGHMGSCAEYLYNTVSHLEDLGIRDRNLWRLQELVASEIRSLQDEGTHRPCNDAPVSARRAV